MRQTIRLEVGVGWQLRGREVGGVEKTQVTYQYPDGLGKKNPRSSVFLPYDWSSRNQSKITTAVADLKRLMEERNLSLKEAPKRYSHPQLMQHWYYVHHEFLKYSLSSDESF